MFKARIAGALTLLAALCFILGTCNITTPTAEDSLRKELSANWDFELPEGYEVIYRKTDRGGFNGDGNTYTVIEYPHPLPDSIFDWASSAPRGKFFTSSRSKEAFYDDMNVISELRYDFAGYDMLLMQDALYHHVDDELYIFHLPGDNRLYIIECYT